MAIDLEEDFPEKEVKTEVKGIKMASHNIQGHPEFLAEDRGICG